MPRKGRLLGRRTFLGALSAAMALPSAALIAPPPRGGLRLAVFNAGLARKGAGVLIHDLQSGDPQAQAVAEIVLRVRPDVLVLNELDADPEGRALALFQALLARGTAEVPGLDYPETFQGPQNVGHFSGLDLDGDGRAAGPGDAWGFGRFPGQYAMALLSRWPLGSVRSFTDFPWAALPGARRPLYPDGTPFHPEAVWQRLRLSSKSHWIAPVHLPGADEPLHLIAAHPTPPVFDGPEDRNGRRNADEIRLIRAILDDAPWLIDDAGGRGGLARDALTAVAGDLNADPHDGDGHRDEINALLSHPRLIDPAPESPGAAEISERTPKQGPRARHTADWPDGPAKPGNLRVDYLLPGRSFEVLGAGVFWPARTDPLAHLVAMRPRPVSSDHRLVWADVRLRR